MTENETTALAIDEETSSAEPEIPEAAEEETSTPSEGTSASDDSTSETEGVTSLDTENTNAETDSIGETQPVTGGEASSGSTEVTIYCTDYTDVLESILDGTDSQKVLLESLLSGSTEQWELAAQTYALQQERIDALLASSQRQEQQLEACISFMVIFIVVMLLNYCYKFIKIFL